MSRPTAVSWLVVIVFCLLISSAASLKLPPIRIGLTVSQSGKYQAPSAMIHRAFQIWEEDINSRGGLLGREVQLLVYDDQSNEKLVGHLYEQLIITDKVDLVFSPYGTPLTLAASEVTERHKFVMLASGASGEENWSRGHRHLFGVYAPASRYFIGFLDIMARHGLMSVAILYEQSSFNMSAAQGAREWAARFGIKVALFRGYKQGASELPQIIPEVIKQNPDGLILCAYPDDGYLLLELLRNAKHRPRALGITITPTFPEFVVRAKDMAEGVFAPSQWEPMVRMPFPGTKEFLEKFMAAKGEIPQYHATAAFAAAEVLSKAVTATGSLDHGKIRDFIQNLDTVTVIGRFKVDHTGLQIGHNPILIQWQKGKKEIVYPTSMRTAPPLFDLPGKGIVHENPQQN